MDKKILVTGATGFLGSHIMAALLLKGEKLVIPGRSSSGEPLRLRIAKLLRWFGIEHLSANLELYETDYLLPSIGLSENEYASLCSLTGSIIHCASDTSFAEKNRERVMKSNVDNLKEILDLAAAAGVSSFHYISTAYAAGIDSDEITEAPVSSENFTNVYEESKAIAERIVSGRCSSESVPYTIIRPSIVYGNSVTGRSLRFNALYYPVMSLCMIRDIYLEDIKNRGGIKSAEAGIFINDDGRLHIPIRIYIPNDGKINLIPVDYFVNAVLSIISHTADGRIFHLTSDRPASMELLVQYTSHFLNLTGAEVVIGESGSGKMSNAAEELFNHFIKAYRPYLSDRRTFARNNTDSVTGALLPPELTYEAFARCMKYASDVDWGKNLFNS